MRRAVIQSYEPFLKRYRLMNKTSTIFSYSKDFLLKNLFHQEIHFVNRDLTALQFLFPIFLPLFFLLNIINFSVEFFTRILFIFVHYIDIFVHYTYNSYIKTNKEVILWQKQQPAISVSVWTVISK